CDRICALDSDEAAVGTLTLGPIGQPHLPSRRSRLASMIDPRQIRARVFAQSGDPSAAEVTMTDTRVNDHPAVLVCVPAFRRTLDQQIVPRLLVRLVDSLSADPRGTAVLTASPTPTGRRRERYFEGIVPLRGSSVENLRADVFDALSDVPPARDEAINQLRALLLTGPAELREQLRGLTTGKLINTCAGLRPTTGLADPVQATKAALRRLARRHQQLSAEIRELDAELAPLVTATVPELLALPGVGIEVAGQLLVTAGDNPERLRSEAAFAHLCGVAPIPASSGRTDRHRLNRGGDRAANTALHTIVLSRLRWDPRTRAYLARRRHQGLTKPEAMRCLKRYIAREAYRKLINTPYHTKDKPAAA
ncbi:MAG TPA: transposase, partial [Pseudonocardiaceae bacterium]|nr:transposase [Pseudonocardiaceae bacterium]